MGDDADELIAPGQPGQRINGLFKAVGVKRAEALVNKQCFDDHAARVLLDRIADAQRKAQGGHKALAARQTAHRAGLAGVGVKNIEIQRGLAADGLAPAAQQAVLPVRHAGEAQVGSLDHTVKIERLYILFKRQLDFAGQVAVDRFGEVVPHGPLFPGGSALPHGLVQGIQRGAVGVQPVDRRIAGVHSGGAVAAQPGQRLLQALQRIGVIPLGHRLLHLLHAGRGSGVACLGVGGAAGGGKLLLVQFSQLAGQDVCLLGKALGAVGLLLQLQVVGLQAAQPLGQTLLLGGQGGFQLVRCQLGGGPARIAVPAAGEKSICVALQCRAQLMRVGSGVTGGAAGGGRCAALGRQLLLALLQLLFGDVVLGQGRDLGVAGRAADRAGLALFQIAGQQAGAVGVKLALQRAVLLLGLVQRGLRRHIGGLAVCGVLPGLVGVLQLAQKLPAVGGKPLRQLNAVVGFQQVGLSLAQRGAVGLVFGNALLEARRPLFKISHDDVGLVLDIGGALLLGNEAGQLAAAGGALLGNFKAGVTAGDLLVQLLHDGGLALLVRLIGLKQQLAKLGGSACGKGVAVVLHFG